MSRAAPLLGLAAAAFALARATDASSPLPLRVLTAPTANGVSESFGEFSDTSTLTVFLPGRNVTLRCVSDENKRRTSERGDDTKRDIFSDESARAINAAQANAARGVGTAMPRGSC